MLILAGIGILFVAILHFGVVGYGEYTYFSFYSLRNYVDLPSLLAVLIPLLLFLFFTKNGKILWGYIKSSFKKGCGFSGNELTGIASAAKSTANFVLAEGALLFIGSIIAIMANMNFQDELFARALFVDIAVSSILLLYAIAIAFFILYPLRVWATNKLNEENISQ